MDFLKLYIPFHSILPNIRSRMGGAGGQTRRLPHTKPPFTVADIKKAIPQHCFKRSILRSFFYLVQDLIFAYIFYYISTQYFFDLPYPLHYLAWPLYWICQGCAISALWILGHECGHHAFSDYQLVDDTIGFIIHSAFLTPYFSWKISHRRHHSNTASLEREEVYVPLLKCKRGKIDYLLSHTVAGRAFVILIRLSAGWVLYLSFNLLGRKYGRFTNHFIPQSPIFSKDEQKQVILSDAGILATAYGLYCLVSANGLWWVIYVYGVPVLILNAFIALITYLHHTHAEIPYYDSFEWDWLRGGLATVDRDYGILNYLFHDIGSAHIMHHLFPSMPHYHTMEATKAIKPILGDYYHFDGTPILKAFWREAKECVYIEPDISNNKGVFWYTNDI